MKKKITFIAALCIALCGLPGCSGGTAQPQTAAGEVAAAAAEA